MNIKPILYGWLLCVGLLTLHANASPVSTHQFKLRTAAIHQQYRQAVKACDTLNWNANTVCLVEALATKHSDIAELNMMIHPSAQSRLEADRINAQGQYEVALARCDDDIVYDRSECLHEAIKQREIALEEANALWRMSYPDGSPKPRPASSNTNVMDRVLAKPSSPVN